MSSNNFYRTVLTVEVLSEEPIDDGLSLADIAREGAEGSFSLVVTTQATEAVSGVTMAQLLAAQGSDPGFFMLDDAGCRLDI